jgi:dihydrofolate reductase
VVERRRSGLNVVPEKVAKLKAQPCRDLALAGADLAASFMRLGLIDEYRIYVHPIVIGTGQPLFPRSGPSVNLRLLETRGFGNGVLLLHYRKE